MSVIPSWAETTALANPSGNMPVAGDACAAEGCETIFHEGDRALMPNSASPDGHVHRHGWVCGKHAEFPRSHDGQGGDT